MLFIFPISWSIINFVINICDQYFSFLLRTLLADLGPRASLGP